MDILIKLLVIAHVKSYNVQINYIIYFVIYEETVLLGVTPLT
jgi:hypothetical protein